MPASFSHYRFGKMLLPSLPADVRQCIQRFRRMYDTGLQGPDLFFYHNIFTKSSIGDLGRSFHRQSGKEFFTRACTQVDSEAAQAYLYGLLAHYCLDSQCHPFIRQMVTIEEADHVALESEFDRVMLQKDGISSPHTYDRGKHIRLTRGECITASAFFPPTTGAQISGCVRSMAHSLKFLSNANRARTEKLVALFAPIHLNQMVPAEENPDYGYMVGQLQELFDQALARYPLLLQQLQQHRKDGTELSEAFEADYG